MEVCMSAKYNILFIQTTYRLVPNIFLIYKNF